MQLELHEGEVVYCTVKPARMKPAFEAEPLLSAVCQFQDPEGLTLIVSRADAEAHGFEYTYSCRMITLRIHSSINAVGFLASVTEPLAKRRITGNAISAYFHDHLLVPIASADEAMRLFSEISFTVRSDRRT
ncbi:ACT domain-containing protein [Rubripirellula reticaptiva]|uniref:ACT domain protein n=1 Tax=Rubripirellula reticaptiva TaxID=2528013 RepID=A0A5C6EF39_9BACT|nr:ACT domain-containing protein [Rubripirellula reticaptiva]TWU47135.1 ACT domain protein [Rubripirellula reticaptiva]